MAENDQVVDLSQMFRVQHRKAWGIPTSLRHSRLRSARPAEVRLGPNRLEWRRDGFSDLPGEPASNCLFNFLELANSANPEDFVKYAATHGVLELTPLGFPEYSWDNRPPHVPGDKGWFYESVTLWKAYAQNAKMILALSLALRGEERVNVTSMLDAVGLNREALVPAEAILKELEQLSPDAENPHVNHILGLTSPFLSEVPLLESLRAGLAARLQYDWLEFAHIEPRVEWSTGAAKLTLESRRSTFVSPSYAGEGIYWPLFSVLAAELVQLVCTDQNIGVCSQCQAFHPSQRKVRLDQPHYCSTCQPEVRKATWRKASRRQYAQQKAEAISQPRKAG